MEYVGKGKAMTLMKKYDQNVLVPLLVRVSYCSGFVDVNLLALMTIFGIFMGHYFG